MSTATTLSWPARSAAAGNGNDICVESPPAVSEPRKAPFSQTENAPWVPPPTVRLIPVSLPVAVKWPRYHTNPVWKP